MVHQGQEYVGMKDPDSVICIWGIPVVYVTMKIKIKVK